jgi:hypothetical protein
VFGPTQQILGLRNKFLGGLQSHVQAGLALDLGVIVKGELHQGLITASCSQKYAHSLKVATFLMGSLLKKVKKPVPELIS